MSEEIFLQLKGIKKNFNGVTALNGIDLQIRKGEIHCLAGGNGSGKSTLIKIISGVYEPNEGSIFINGKKMTHIKPIDAINCGIQVIYQDFAVFPNLTVAENIALSGELKNKSLFVNRKKAQKTADRALSMIGANIDTNALLDSLTVAEKQMVAICRAVINEPQMLILDEPTTALTAREVEKLWDIVRNLKEKGIAVLLVDHKLDELNSIADRLTVIRNGEFVSGGEVSEYHHRKFIRDLTGHDISDEKYCPEPSSENILTVEHLTRKNAYTDISFSINKGDILGITGLLGSGRSEIGKALFGLCPAESGRIVLCGKEITVKNIKDAIKNKIAYVPEDRLTEGLFTQRSIKDNIIASSAGSFKRHFKLSSAEIDKASEKYIKDFGIVTPSADNPVSSLSGGNAQKVVISKWLSTKPKLLILNGPTVGVDIGAKAEIHAILRELAQKGTGIIIITDDLPELVQNCNKIIIIRNKKTVAKTDNSISKKTIANILIGAEKGDEKQ